MASVCNQCNSLSLFDENFGIGMDFNNLKQQFREWIEKQTTSYPVTTNTVQSSEATVTTHDDKFQVTIDVYQFKSEEITIKVVGSNTICIEGNHEEQHEDSGFISRHFVRKFTLPNGYDIKSVVSTLSSDGILRIVAARNGQTIDNYQNITIQQPNTASITKEQTHFNEESIQNSFNSFHEVSNKSKETNQELNKINSAQEFQEAHNYIQQFLHNIDSQYKIVPIKQVGPFTQKTDVSAQNVSSQYTQETYSTQKESRKVPIQQTSTYSSSIDTENRKHTEESQYRNIPITQTNVHSSHNEAVNKSFETKCENSKYSIDNAETHIQNKIEQEYRKVPNQQTEKIVQNSTESTTELVKNLNWESNATKANNTVRERTIPIEQTGVHSKQKHIKEETFQKQNTIEETLVDSCNYKKVPIQLTGISSQVSQNKTHKIVKNSSIDSQNDIAFTHKQEVENTQEHTEIPVKENKVKSTLTEETIHETHRQNYRTVPIQQTEETFENTSKGSKCNFFKQTEETIQETSKSNFTTVPITQTKETFINISNSSNHNTVEQVPPSTANNTIKSTTSIEEVETWNINNKLPSKETEIITQSNNEIQEHNTVKKYSTNSKHNTMEVKYNINETQSHKNTLEDCEDNIHTLTKSPVNESNIKTTLTEESTIQEKNYRTVPINQSEETCKNVSNTENYEKTESCKRFAHTMNIADEPKLVPVKQVPENIQPSTTANNTMKSTTSIEEVETWNINNKLPSKQTEIITQLNNEIQEHNTVKKYSTNSKHNTMEEKYNINETQSHKNTLKGCEDNIHKSTKSPVNESNITTTLTEESTIQEKNCRTVPIKQSEETCKNVSNTENYEKTESCERFTHTMNIADEPKLVPVKLTPEETGLPSDLNNTMKSVHSIEEIETWEIHNKLPSKKLSSEIKEQKTVQKQSSSGIENSTEIECTTNKTQINEQKQNHEEKHVNLVNQTMLENKEQIENTTSLPDRKGSISSQITKHETYEQKFFKTDSIESQCSIRTITDYEETENWGQDTNKTEKHVDIASQNQKVISENSESRMSDADFLKTQQELHNTSKHLQNTSTSSTYKNAQEVSKHSLSNTNHHSTEKTSGITEKNNMSSVQLNKQEENTALKSQDQNLIFQENDFSEENVVRDNYKQTGFTNKNAKAEFTALPDGFKMSNKETFHSEKTKTEWAGNKTDSKPNEYQVQFSVDSNNSDRFSRMPSETSEICIEEITEENEGKTHTGSSSGYRRQETTQFVTNTEHTVHVQRN